VNDRFVLPNRPVLRTSKLFVYRVLAVVLVLGLSGVLVAKDSSAAAAPLLPAKCLPIPGPNHGAGGNQYEVHFKLLRDCDEAVGLFRSAVGQTPPNRPRNSPRLWWDGPSGFKCDAGNGGRALIVLYCESGDRGFAFNPIPAGLASPTTILVGQIPTSAEAQILVEGSPFTDESCVVTGPSVVFRGLRITKWALTMKNDAASAVGCSFAESWLARMVRQNGRGPRVAMATAPRGWKCYGTTTRIKAVVGVCKKTGSTAYFGWAPVPPDN
jgi:hypothetical protein